EGRYYDWPVGFHVGQNLSDFWTLDSAEPGRQDFLYFADGTAHKNDAGERLRDEPHVPARRHLLRLSRRARHERKRGPSPAGRDGVPPVPRTAVAERPAHADARIAHAPPGRIAGQRVRRLPHAADRADDRRRQRSEPYLPLH